MAEHYNLDPNNIPAPKTRKIWLVFWILLGLTAVEFLLAFTVSAGTFRTGIFVILTLVKAFYIVAEFMHLGQEIRILILSILLPPAFILWLIAVLFLEVGTIY